MTIIEPVRRRHRHKRRHARTWQTGETWGVGVLVSPSEIERMLRRARTVGCILAAILGIAITLIAMSLRREEFKNIPVTPGLAGTWHPFKSLQYR